MKKVILERNLPPKSDSKIDKKQIIPNTNKQIKSRRLTVANWEVLNSSKLSEHKKYETFLIIFRLLNNCKTQEILTDDNPIKFINELNEAP